MVESNLLNWEIDWIKNNLDRYDSVAHANAVIENIRKEYYIKKLESHVKQFEKTKTTKSYYELFDFVNEPKVKRLSPEIISN